MSLDLADDALAAAHASLAPHGRALLERAADVALRVHAEELTTEHLLCALMEDEESAAHRLVLHAFADPETIAIESLATAPGILVVGSERTIPFSVRGVETLYAARTRAARAGAAAVRAGHLLEEAVERLPGGPEGELRGELAGAGYRRPEGGRAEEPEAGPALEDAGALFRHFDEDARRVLALAGKLAAGWKRPSVGPAHLVIACVEHDRELARRSGLGAGAARRVLRERDRDDTPIEPRPVPAASELRAFLASLPARADSVALLGQFLRHGAPELVQLLVQNRITDALLERAGDGFRDPAPDGGHERGEAGAAAGTGA